MNEIRILMRKIEAHHNEFPDHGVDCACMDPLIREARRMTNLSHRPSLQRRVDYVLRRAADNRPPVDRSAAFTTERFVRLSPGERGHVSYMQGEWNPAVPDDCPYPSGSVERTQWEEGRRSGHIQESEQE